MKVEFSTDNPMEVLASWLDLEMANPPMAGDRVLLGDRVYVVVYRMFDIGALVCYVRLTRLHG